MSGAWKNAKTLLHDPGMVRAYAAWSLGALTGRRQFEIDGGVRIAGFRHFSEFWGASNGRPSPSEIALVRRCMEEGRAALDVGANIGQFALTMAAFGTRATVHAFEPVASTFARLVGNIERNRCASVVANQLAVSDSGGYVRLTSDDGSPATNRISNEASARFVHSVTLDEYCAAWGMGTIDLLKIDVEGAEPLVLRGAKSLLAGRRVKAMLIEVCPANLTPFAFSVEDLSRPLREAGYGLYRLMPDGNRGDELGDKDLANIRLENALALPS